MYKTFIIGCGKIAGLNNNESFNSFTHGSAYKNNNKVKIVGCMDINSNNGNLFSKKYNTDYFNDYHIGINKTNPQIISVCSPDDTHYSITKDLLQMHSDIRIIFLEKPICTNQNQMKDLIKLSKEKNIIILPNHSRRFDNRYKKIRQSIINNEYGEFVNGLVTYYGGWMHNGIHIVDTLSFIFNDTININTLKSSLNSQSKNDETLDGKLEFSSTTGVIDLMSFNENYYQLFEFDLRFKKSRLKIEDFGERILLENKEVNNIGENVLVIKDNEFPVSKDLPIDNAVSLIIDYLDTNNIKILDGYKINDIIDSMRTIWDGLEYYEKN